MSRPLFRGAVCALLAAAGLARSPSALADDTQQAREAYDRGTAAHRRGDFTEAAADFALADSLAPSPVALRAALDDAIKADDPVLGMELLERSNRAPVEGALATSVSTAQAKFKGRAGRIAVHCPAAHTCLATLDRRAMDIAKPAWATVGQHTLIIQLDDSAQPRLVDVKPDQTLDVTPTAPPPAPPPSLVPAPAPALAPVPAPAPAPSPSGLSPLWFALSAGATALSAGATVFSGVDTANKHQAFTDDNCARAAGPGCASLANDGSSAETRTNVLVGVTAALGVATVVVLLFTRWGSGGDAHARVGLAPGGAGGVFEF